MAFPAPRQAARTCSVRVRTAWARCFQVRDLARAADSPSGLSAVRHNNGSSALADWFKCGLQTLDLLCGLFCIVRVTVKGKSVERRGRKATGLKGCARSARSHDSGVASDDDNQRLDAVKVRGCLVQASAAVPRCAEALRGQDRMNVIVFSNRGGACASVPDRPSAGADGRHQRSGLLSSRLCSSPACAWAVAASS